MPETLEKVFDFKESDLLMNQNGRLSENQIRIISQYRQMGKFFGRVAFVVMFLSLAAVSFIALYNIGIDLENNPAPVVAYSVFFSVGMLLFIVSFLVGSLRSDLKSGKISVVEGFAEKRKRKISRQLGTAYYLTIDNVKFQLDEQAKYQAIDQNACYRIYYIKHLPHIILSVIEIPIIR